MKHNLLFIGFLQLDKMRAAYRNDLSGTQYPYAVTNLLILDGKIRYQPLECTDSTLK